MGEFFNSKLYIIKIQNYLSKKVKSRFVSSLIIIFAPTFITGFILQKFYYYNIFTRDIFTSLLWLAIAPLLIQDAFFIFNNFFNSHYHLLDDKEAWDKIKKDYISRFESRRFVILEVFWALICTSVIVLIIFQEAPIAVKIWAFVVYFILFFLSATGIRGMLLMTHLISFLCKIKIKVDPLHYDYFGGIESFGKFIIQGTFYFSTGALLFPLVFSLLKKVSPDEINIILLIYVLTIIFIVLLMYSFMAPVYTLKKYVEKEKNKLKIESWSKINRLYEDAKKDNSGRFPTELYFHTEIYHKKILAIKDYPYDTAVIFELFVSVLLPVAIAVMEIIKPG